MKLRTWSALVGISLAALGTGMVVKSCLPRKMVTGWTGTFEETGTAPEPSSSPEVKVAFLRCGSVTVPEFIAVRGVFSLAPRVMAHSAVLVRHPKATFLYDTGLCRTISTYLAGLPWLFRKTVGNFLLEQAIGEHLQSLNMRPEDVDFVVLSHLHWDHVSGIPDLPGVPLRINRVEYDAAKSTLFEMHQGLVQRLMGNNPVELFECNGPGYEGFHSSYDLFGDGSVVLVPLPGHTAGNTGMFINKANGPRLFLIGDAAWVAENYLHPATMHPIIWSNSAITSDDASACQTLIDLHHLAHRYPEMPIIAMHDARMQDLMTQVEYVDGGYSVSG